MAQHIPGLGGNEFRRPHHLAFGGELLHDELLLGRRELDKFDGHLRIEPTTLFHLSLRHPPLIEDFDRSLILLGLPHRVFVDEIIKDVQSVAPVTVHDRRAGEANLGGIGQGSHQVGVKFRGVRAVALIDEQ